MARLIYRHYQVLALLAIVRIGRSQSLHFTGENIASNKPTEQRPGTWIGNYMHVTPSVFVNASSDLAVDGNTASAFESGSCSHTRGPINTKGVWSVDLGDTYLLNGVRIYNRNRVKDHLDNFKILGYPNKTTLHDDATAETKLARRDIIDIPVPAKTFDNITITIPAHPARGPPLTLCEVEIYGVLASNNCSTASTDEKLIWNINYGFIDTERNFVVAESIIGFTCPPYYALTGAASVTCLSTGRFNDSIPFCLERVCSAPVEITHGFYMQNVDKDYIVGEILAWDCSEGYFSTQNKTRLCLATSEWSGTDPVCTLITCSFPPRLLDGHLTFQNGSTYDQGTLVWTKSVTVNCDSCFTPNVPSITCTQRGVWDTLPMCSRIECDKIGATAGWYYIYLDQNGSIISDDKVTFACGTVTVVVCEEGHTKTTGRRVCGHDGIPSWAGVDIPCEAQPTNDVSHVTVSAAVAGGIGGGMFVVGLGVGIAVAAVIWKWRTGRRRSIKSNPPQPPTSLAPVDNSCYMYNAPNVGTDGQEYTELNLARN